MVGGLAGVGCNPNYAATPTRNIFGLKSRVRFGFLTLATNIRSVLILVNTRTTTPVYALALLPQRRDGQCCLDVGRVTVGRTRYRANVASPYLNSASEVLRQALGGSGV